MILTTTPTIEGQTIREYKGLVTGETIIGANFWKDFKASIRDIVGGRSGSYEEELIKARTQAMDEMSQRAAELGAALAAPARHKGGVPGRRAAFPQTSSFQKIFKNIKKLSGYIKIP